MGGWDAPWHWVVLAVLVIALFGYKKLPDAARALGRSLRIFKTEIKGMGQDDRARSEASSNPTAPAEKVQPAIEPPRAQTVPNPAAARPRPMPTRQPPG